MSDILTAEEFVKEFRKTNPIADAESIEHWMAQHCIEFAKLHVEAALKSASKQAKTKEDIAIFAEGSYKIQVVDKDSILNAYPLENIK